MKKSLLLIMLHAACIWAEVALWHQPHDMPVPAFIVAIGLLWFVVFVLSFVHAKHILAWMNAPSPDIAELIRNDTDRRQLEMDALMATNPWVDQ